MSKDKKLEHKTIKNIENNLTTIKAKKEPYPNICYPQADSIKKIIQLVEFIEKGYNNKKQLSKLLQVTSRQVDYYSNAARYLGFVETIRAQYTNTSYGTKLAKSSKKNKELLVINSLFATPSIRKIFKQLLPKTLTFELIIDSMRRSGIYLNTRKMEKRRGQTIYAWVVWALDKL